MINGRNRLKSIKKLRAKGYTLRNIGLKFGVSPSRIGQILENRQPIDKWLRFRILGMNGFACAICELKFDSNNVAEIHHIDRDPSNNEYYNLAPLCKDCHIRVTKADKELRDEYKKKKVKCRHCKKSELVFVSDGYKSIFCSQDCKKKWWLKNGIIANRTPKEWRKINNERTKAYYQKHKNDPSFKAKLIEYNKKAYKKNPLYYRNYWRVKNKIPKSKWRKD